MPPRSAQPVAQPPAVAEGLAVAPGAALALAEAFRAQEALFAATLIRDSISVFMQLNPQDVRGSWPPIERSLLALGQQAYQTAGMAGQAYYSQARAVGLAGSGVLLGTAATAAAAGGFLASIPPLPAVSITVNMLRMTGPWTLLKNLQGGQPYQRAIGNSSILLSGSMARLALNAARDTVTNGVKADPKAVAWMRVLGPRPCGFCAMLASRGPVYKNAQTAGFKAHNHCMCVAAPAFSKSEVKRLSQNDLYDLWKRITEKKSGKDAINAWRRYWDKHDNGSIAQPFEAQRGIGLI